MQNGENKISKGQYGELFGKAGYTHSIQTENVFSYQKHTTGKCSAVLFDENIMHPFGRFYPEFVFRSVSTSGMTLGDKTVV